MDWIKLILSPGYLLGIPLDEIHKFQIFAAVESITIQVLHGNRQLQGINTTILESVWTDFID